MTKIAIGIDLGTVNICVATYDGIKMQTIQMTDGHTTPSYVYYDPKNGKIYHGKSAKNKNHKNVINDAKRFIGRRFHDEEVQKIYQNYQFEITSESDGNVCFKVPYNNEIVTKKPEEISAELLRYIREQVCEKCKVDGVEAVITVPAHFNHSQREKTKQAAESAGIKVLKLVNEPTAAALSYFHDGFKRNLKAMVFDLGGGTFDISIIDINDEEIVVETVKGDTFLGGVNFDENVMNYFQRMFEKQGETIEQVEQRKIKSAANKLKEILSSHETAETTIYGLFNDEDKELSLDKSTFNEINTADFDKCLDVVKKCLHDKDINPESIDEIIMVGGSSRIPKLQEMVSEYFKGKKIMCDLDPDEAVARGAAIQAFKISYQSEDTNKETILPKQIYDKLQIIDVCPLTLGVGITYDEMSPIIPRNARIPVSKSKKYVTSMNNQKQVTFDIFEGERAYTKFNNLLGKLEITDIPGKAAAKISAEVTFTVDEDGLLSVSAKCEGQETTVDITLNINDANDEKVKYQLLNAKDNEDYDTMFKEFVIQKRKLKVVLNKYPGAESDEFDKLLTETTPEAQNRITRKLNESNTKLAKELKKIWNDYLNPKTTPERRFAIFKKIRMIKF